MVGVLHGHGFGFKTISFGQSANFFGVVISHQEITSKIFADGKKLFMVYDRMSIEPRTGTLATGSIWRINEKNSIGIMTEFGEAFKAVAMYEFNSICNKFNIGNP